MTKEKEIIKAEALPVKVDGNTGLIIEEKMSTEEIVEKVRAYVDSKEKKIVFNGKRYPEIDDWEYIGTFYGLKMKTFEPTFIEIGGSKGFKARAALYDDKQNEVGRAESYCMTDEPNWARKPLFQLASMAQTRAGAKAYSNLFRPIVRLCAMETTPYEEMTDDNRIERKEPDLRALASRMMLHKEEIPFPSPQEIDQSEEIMTDEIAELPPRDEIVHMQPEEVQQAAQNYKKPYVPQERKPGTISEKQGKLLFAKRRAAKVPDNAWKAFAKDQLGVEHDRDIPWQEMDRCIKWIDRYQAL